MSIKSMTGYGAGGAISSALSVSVELRSVNHRYLEMSVRSLGRFAPYEETVKKAIKTRVSRGKIDVRINAEVNDPEKVTIAVDMATAAAYHNALEALRDNLGMPGELSIDTLAGLPGVLGTDKLNLDEEETVDVFTKAALAAAAALDEMRSAEGRRLADDMIARAEAVTQIVDMIEEKVPLLPGIYAEKLGPRIAELTSGHTDSVSLDERIALEVAVLADKSSIAEEVVRLRSHVSSLEKILSDDTGSVNAGDTSVPTGKKLDFIIQEMNREANTIGSKANDLEISQAVIELKSEIEKIREQVQNIE